MFIVVAFSAPFMMTFDLCVFSSVWIPTDITWKKQKNYYYVLPPSCARLFMSQLRVVHEYWPKITIRWSYFRWNPRLKKEYRKLLSIACRFLSRPKNQNWEFTRQAREPIVRVILSQVIYSILESLSFSATLKLKRLEHQFETALNSKNDSRAKTNGELRRVSACHMNTCAGGPCTCLRYLSYGLAGAPAETRDVPVGFHYE